jgi:hypothetical protein
MSMWIKTKKFLEEAQSGLPIRGSLFNSELFVNCVVIDRWILTVTGLEDGMVICHQIRHGCYLEFNMVEVKYKII